MYLTTLIYFRRMVIGICSSLVSDDNYSRRLAPTKIIGVFLNYKYLELTNLMWLK